MVKKLVIVLISLFIVISDISAEENSIGEITWVEGTVKVEYPSKSPEDGKIGMNLFLNATISTGENSRAMIKLSDGSILSIAPKTKILIESLIKDQDKRVASVLTFVGRVRAFVKKQINAKSKFEFKSKTAIAGVRGTHLALDVLENGNTKVYLFSGFVGVFNREKMELPEIMLSEGTFSEIKAGEAPSPPQIIPPEILQDIYTSTSIMAMLKNEMKKTAGKGVEIMPETKTLSSNLEERLIFAFREAEKEELSKRSTYSQSLTEPLRDQDIQGVVTPQNYIGEIESRKVDVNIFIDVNNY